MGSMRQDAGVAQLAEHELPKLGVAGSNPVARSSSHEGVLCEAAQLTVIRLPHIKSRCQIKRNDMSDAVNAQKAPMPVEVEEVKIISGAPVAKVQNSHFTMAAIKIPASRQ